MIALAAPEGGRCRSPWYQHLHEESHHFQTPKINNNSNNNNNRTWLVGGCDLSNGTKVDVFLPGYMNDSERVRLSV